MKSKILKRQFEDYILTDLVADERGDFFSHIKIYEFLIGNKSGEKILKTLRRRSKISKKFVNADFHAAPLKYKISNKKSFREISLLNPLSIFESYFFMSLFGEEIVKFINTNNLYGVRKPIATHKLLYKTSDKKLVYYKDEDEKSGLLRNIEGSCNFYRHLPHKYLTDFLKSNEFSMNLDLYSYCLHFDIENFFGSIYTHSFSWSIASKTLDAKTLGQTGSLFQNIDTFLQNLNQSKTNGIVIGPEISRLMAEFLLVNIEKKINRTLNYHDIKYKTDYKLFRFVDDYYLFTNDKVIEEKVYKIIAEELSVFHLKLKDSKTEEYSRVENEWLEYININLIAQNVSFFTPKETRSVHSTFKKSNYTGAKNNIEIIIDKYPKQKDRIISYILTTILRQVTESSKINLRNDDFINYIFWLLSKSPSYQSIKKVCAILDYTFELSELLIERGYILVEEMFMKFADRIITEYPSDWINLIIYFASKGINLSRELEEKVYFLIMSTNDPRLVAGLLIYYSMFSDRTFKKEYTEVIKKICRQISQINISKINDFFLDEKSWWLFIFYSFPRENSFSGTAEKLFTKKLVPMMERTRGELLGKINRENSSISHSIQALTLHYLFQEETGFVIWDMLDRNIYKDFCTSNRTLFNPIERTRFMDVSG